MSQELNLPLYVAYNILKQEQKKIIQWGGTETKVNVCNRPSLPQEAMQLEGQKSKFPKNGPRNFKS